MIEPDARRAFTLSEVMLATFIMVLAFLPVAGVITKGVGQSDVSVSYTTAMDIGQATMNALLSPSVKFNQIPLSPFPLGITQFTDTTTTGSVGANAALDSIIPGSSVVSSRRTVTNSGIRYFIDLWTAVARSDTDLKFYYYKTPHVKFDTPQPGNLCYYNTLVLGSSDWANYSPYNKDIPTTNVYSDGGAWAQAGSEVEVLQSGYSTPTTDLIPTPASAIYANLMKILLRVSWPKDRGGPPARTFWLLSYKARLN